MSLGILLILFGVLIVLYPQILQIMIAGLFITIGVVICAISWRLRRMRKAGASGVASWITRF